MEDCPARVHAQISSYRWVILLAMIPILAMTNVFWLTFAPITGTAVEFYGVPPLSIALLSMSYMVVYIIMAFPASWIIDSKGFRVSMGIGALITAVFGLVRGIYASNFTVVTLAQFGVAIGQPFLVNSITKVAARWFPVHERATATGIATMAGYAGMILALVLTPLLTTEYGLAQMLMIDGWAAAGCAIVFLLFTRERPQTPPGPGDELVNRVNLSDLKGLFHKKDFQYLMICLFVIMGIFNAVMTWIEDMLRPRGISPAQAGLIGGLMVVVGIMGAVILPALSDRLRRRRPLLVWPILVAIPGFIGIAFAADYRMLLVASGLMGFFVMGMGPIAFQYGAEKAYPVPEGTSYGLLMLMGQISGVLFVYFMDATRLASGEMTPSLVVLILLMLAAFILATRLRESDLIDNAPGRAESPDPSAVQKARQIVCDSGKRLVRSGLASGTWGNISCRVNDDYMVITPSGRDYEGLTPDDMVLVNLNNLKFEGSIKPSSERGLHAEIYKQRKETGAVIHTHSPNASTIAACRREVPPLLDDMAQIVGPSIRVADYAIPGTKKLIKATMKALAGRNAVLLANHGAICIGRDMTEAFVTCEIMEKSCRTFIESEFLGGAVPLGRIEARVMHEYYLKKYSQQPKKL